MKNKEKKLKIISIEFLGEKKARNDQLPDIDLDFESRGRDWVKRYIETKYGKMNVCSLATYGRLQLRAAIKDVSKIKNLGFEYVNKVTKGIFGNGWTDLVEALSRYENVRDFVEENPDIMSIVERCIGQVRHSSIHPAGVIISPKYRTLKNGKKKKAHLDDFIPIKFMKGSGDEKELVSEWEGNFVERRGLLKVDILGIRQLDIFKLISDLVKKNKGMDIDFDNIPLDDDKVFEKFREGDTEGVFQFKSHTQKEYQKSLKADNIEHLIASNALLRPGAMISNAHKKYIDIKEGKSYPEFDKGLEVVTKDTFGLYVYQEQIMQAMVVGGGLSLAEADIVRCISGETILYLCSGGGGSPFSKSERSIEELYNRVYKKSKGKNRFYKEGEIYKNKRFKNKDFLFWVRYYDKKDNVIKYGKMRDIIFNGKQKTWIVLLKNNKKIRITKKHRLLTVNGYKKLYELKIGDEILCNGDLIKNKIVRYTGEGSGGWQKDKKNLIKLKNGHFAKDRRTIKFKNAKKIANNRSNVCEECKEEHTRYEYHHLDGNHLNNAVKNIIKVCSGCHKKLDYKIGRRNKDKNLHRKYEVETSKIVSIEYFGEENVYDVVMDHPHNFIANGIVSHNSIIKKFDREKMKSFKDKFIKGIKKIHKYNSEDATRVWDKLMAFSSYGFNRSHSCSYAIIGYWCNWFKVYFPEEFWIANLQFASEDDRINYINRILSSYPKVKIKFPDINESLINFKLDGGNIIWGISYIKGVGEKAAVAILKARKGKDFSSLKDFFDRVEKRVVNKRVFNSLILSGAFDKLYDIEEPYERYKIFQDYEKIKKDKSITENIPENDNDYFVSEYNRLLGVNIVNWDEVIKNKKGIDYNLYIPLDQWEDVENNSYIWVAGSILKFFERKYKKDPEKSFALIVIQQNGIEKTIKIWWDDIWQDEKVRKRVKIGRKIAFYGIKVEDSFDNKEVMNSFNKSKLITLK